MELTDNEINLLISRMESDIQQLRELQKTAPSDKLMSLMESSITARRDIVNKLELFKVANSNQNS